MSRPHPADSLSLVLLVVLLALFGTTLRDYGPSWDEEAQATYGDRLLHYYGSGFRDEASLEYRDLYLYGGLFEVLAQGATKVLPFGTYESRHVANGVFGLLGILAVWLSGRRLGGPTAGFLAALLLAATPRYYGHILVNPKDIPFAALAALYVDSALAALATLPEVSARSVVRLGVTLGLALGVRVSGLILPVCVGIVVLLSVREGRGRAFMKIVVLPLVVSWPLMLLFWPWAARGPFTRPFVALHALARGAGGWRVLFAGRWVEVTSPPWSFVPGWFANTLPEFYLVGLVASLVLLRRLGRAELLLFLVITLPPLGAIALHSRQYDAARHFLFLLPPAALLCGLALARLRALGRAGVLALGLALASVVASVLDMARLHPYEYVYFNRLVAGGLKGAATRFELDYWGLSYREGALWLLANYPSPGTRPRKRRIEVANCSLDFLTEGVLSGTEQGRKTFVEVRKRDAPHILLSLENEECDIPLSGPRIYSVEREGVRLLEIRELRHPVEEPRLGSDPDGEGRP